MDGETSRRTIGYFLMAISLPWFVYALGNAARQSNFINAVGWAVPLVIFLVSIYLVVSGRRIEPGRQSGRPQAIRALAVCGLVLLIGGVFVWVFRTLPRMSPMSPEEAFAYATGIGIGILLIVAPSVVHLVRRAKTR